VCFSLPSGNERVSAAYPIRIIAAYAPSTDIGGNATQSRRQQKDRAWPLMQANPAHS
jgi:hypothetical protein